MLDEKATLMQKSYDEDFSNFTYLNSWSNHYNSWKRAEDFKVLFIKYEDLEFKKEETFEKIILFINKLNNSKQDIDEVKFYNAIKSTSFSNLQNKEKNEGFEESMTSQETGKKKIFFNLGFRNKWQKLLPINIRDKIVVSLKKDLKYLGYLND